jgi:hypothetical protein
MRQETSILPNSPLRRTPHPRSERSTVAPQVTAHRSEIALSTARPSRKHLPICDRVRFNYHSVPLAGCPPPAFRFCFAISPKINRHTGKLEPPVSYRKQRTAPPINRHTSQAPCFPFSLFTFPFSLPPFARLAGLISHSTLVTSHCISNRKLEILEPHPSPSLSTNHPVLIANFEPSESSPFRRTFLPHTLNPTPCFSIFRFLYPKPRERYNVSFAETQASHPMRLRP